MKWILTHQQHKIRQIKMTRIWSALSIADYALPREDRTFFCFESFLIFYDKKKKKINSTRSNEDEPRTGAKKVSGFLLFWIIPYLLSYTHQKVREIVKRHQDQNRREFRSTRKRFSFDFIKEAMSTCGFPAELKTTVLSKYKDFYGTEQLEYE